MRTISCLLVLLSILNCNRANTECASLDPACNVSTFFTYTNSLPVFYIFLSKATFTGDFREGGTYSTGIEGADAKCNADINKPVTAGIFKALLVDGVNRQAWCV